MIKLKILFQVLVLFGREEQFSAMNQQLLHEIVNSTLQVCAQYNTNNQLSEKSDVLEGFFSMLGTLAKKVPQLINVSGIDTCALFQCGMIIGSLSGIIMII